MILFHRDRVKIVPGSTLIILLVELDGRLCICSKGGGDVVILLYFKGSNEEAILRLRVVGGS